MTDFAGQTVEAARRALAARLKSAAIESAELDARTSDRSRTRPRPDRPDHRPRSANSPRTNRRASKNSPAVASRANRSPAFSARRSSGDCRCNSRPRRWCRGPIPRRWSNWRWNCCAPAETSIARCASPISAPAPARSCWRCCPSCRRRKDSGPTFRRAPCKPPAANAARAGLSDRATFIACDYASGLSGPFDLIVSNPPYIRSADIDGLAAEVRNHDPLAALDGGADGLDAYRALIPQAARLLAPGGPLVVEAGQGQSGPIQALMATAGLMPVIAPKADLAGIPRAVAGHKMAR